MATLVGPQTITVGTHTDAVFSKSWVPKYHNEIKKGNTMVKKANLDTDGEAVLRISHQVSKGIEGHVISLEVAGMRGPDALDLLLVKAQLVLTCKTGYSAEETLLSNVAVALCAYVPTVIGDIMVDLID